MGPSVDLQVWAGRLCVALVSLLAFLGYHYGNVRFVPIAAGFAILAAVCYSWRTHAAAPSRSPAHSGQHRAI
jgi:hypothetical protein